MYWACKTCYVTWKGKADALLDSAKNNLMLELF